MSARAGDEGGLPRAVLTVHDPADGSLVGELEAASESEVETAVRSAA